MAEREAGRGGRNECDGDGGRWRWGEGRRAQNDAGAGRAVASKLVPACQRSTLAAASDRLRDAPAADPGDSKHEGDDSEAGILTILHPSLR